MCLPCTIEPRGVGDALRAQQGEASPVATHARSLRDMIEPRAWSLLCLGCLAMLAPLVVTAAIVGAALEWLRTRARKRPLALNGKTAIVTGGKMTKSLVMCRALRAAGCRVILVETRKYWMVASRFSMHVDRFVTVPVPEQQSEAFERAIRELVEREGASLVVPVTSPSASRYEARAFSRLPPGVRSWSLCEQDVLALDDKVVFARKAKEAGLPMPDTQRMRSMDEILAFNAALPRHSPKRYLLKSCNYDPMRRLDLFQLPCAEQQLRAYVSGLAVSAEAPWLVQEVLEGVEYSSCALCTDGRVLTFTDNQASISCFNYTHAGNSAILNWVSAFVRTYKLSGIVCIDFFVGEDGVARAIECNPRLSSNVTSYHRNMADFGRALLAEPSAMAANADAPADAVQPVPAAEEVNWTLADLYYEVLAPRGLSVLERARAALHIFASKKDAYWDAADPLPFIAQHCVHVPVLLARNVWSGNRWAKVDLCIGKMTEENGD